MTESNLPKHHERYARAWSLYQDDTLSDEARQALENEMDNAQNDFSFAEFQEFKFTLPGFIEHWNEWLKDTDEAFQQVFGRPISK